MRFLCQIYSYTIIIDVELPFNADERQNITVEHRNNTVDLRIEILRMSFPDLSCLFLI